MDSYKFYPTDHKYETENNTNLISVTSLVKKYGQDFDTEYWTLYKAWENALCSGTKEQKKKQFREIRVKVGVRTLKDYSLFSALARAYPTINIKQILEDQQNVDKQWTKKRNRSSNKGSDYHEIKEQRSINRGYEINPWTGEKFKVIVPYRWEKGVKHSTVDLDNLEDGYYPEIILYWKGIIGQCDRLWVKRRRIWVRDFKTNEKIDFENIYQKMKPPLQHLDDCKFNHYRAQLSLYAWLLIQRGYKLEKMAIDHLNAEYPVEYLKEIEDVVLDYSLNILDI